MTKSKYWQDRLNETVDNSYKAVIKDNRHILETYRKAAADVEKKITALSSVRESSRTDQYNLKRLKGFKKEIAVIINALEDSAKRNIEASLSKALEQMSEGVSKELNIKFAMTNTELFKKIAKEPFYGSNYSKRIWKNTKKLEKVLNGIVTNGLVQGMDFAQMSILADRAVNQGLYNTYRLIRTESMHYLNDGARERYKEAGIEQISIFAPVDERRCEVCGGMHDKRYAADKAPILPIHPNCRCRYLPVLDIEED